MISIKLIQDINVEKVKCYAKVNAVTEYGESILVSCPKRAEHKYKEKFFCDRHFDECKINPLDLEEIVMR